MRSGRENFRTGCIIRPSAVQPVSRGGARSQPSPQEITGLLHAWRDGDESALDQLMPLVYDKLRQMAKDQMAWPEAIGMAIEGIESASFLTAEQKREVFYHNAVRFLRLDEKKPD